MASLLDCRLRPQDFRARVMFHFPALKNFEQIFQSANVHENSLQIERLIIIYKFTVQQLINKRAKVGKRSSTEIFLKNQLVSPKTIKTCGSNGACQTTYAHGWDQ